MKTHLAIATIAAIMAISATAGAHEITREKGFYLGLRLSTSNLHTDDETQDFFVKPDGGAFVLLAGYSLNRVFSLELDIIGAGHQTSDPNIDASFAGFELFAHYRWRPGRNFRPYIKGGLGVYGVTLRDSSNRVSVGGGGVPLGGGFDYFFTNHFSLGIDLTHHIIGYSQAEIDLGGNTVGFDIDENGAQTALGLAFNFYF
jgi:hypothetical protein